MINRDSALPVIQQCSLLAVPRSSYYYHPVPPDAEELLLLRRLDELHLKFPYYGARKLVIELSKQGFTVGRKRVRSLMATLGLEALYRKPRTTVPDKEHKVYPYLLRNLTIDRANRVWATDITYIPLAKGFVYLVAVIDWYSRKVLSWKLSNTLDVHFCLEALDEALSKYGTPDIFNSDQGCQFTSTAFTDRLQDAGIKISMDGKGRWMDNRFVERLWKSVKYEEVYLKAYESVAIVLQNIGEYFSFYNRERSHQSLDYRTPDAVYFDSLSNFSCQAAA